MGSILTSVKKMLGIGEEYEHFDQDLVIHINSVFMILNQLGVGPVQGFFITGKEQTWEEFLINPVMLELVKSYVYLKVGLIFDPPTSGVLHEAKERQVKEFEWRINLQAEEGGDYDGSSGDADTSVPPE